MKICITTKGESLDSGVDPRFGRCDYLMILDPETLSYETVKNLSSGEPGGAGIKTGQLVSEKDVDVLITGNIGPNAFRTLNAAGIEVLTGASGTVKEVIDKYKNGDLSSVNEPTVDSHTGM